MAEGANELEEDDLGKLAPSKLGTKEYWDDAYATELVNFNDTGDVGEVWFGESSMNRIVKWIKSCASITTSSSFLDVGCGNGMLLVKLADLGYTNLTGVDYSLGAIQLATSIAVEEQVNIKYLVHVCDILNTSETDTLFNDLKFDVCLDKGTYDAISLNPTDALGCQAKYINNISSLLSSAGVFIICSCNWTKSELLNQFTNKFEFMESLPAPSFSFGGQSGNTVTTLIPQVGKVFPKTLVQENVDEKLDFHCVGLEKDKNLSFPTVEMEGSPTSSRGAEVQALSPPSEPGDGTELTLPELPSILGSRRSSATPSADVTEPPDLLIKGEARKKAQTQISPEVIEEPSVIAPEEVMRANLEPLIDTLFEEDELFAQDFEEDGLNRILFIRKMGIYVEIKTKDYISGVVCTPLFHCPRCKNHWTEFGTLPEDCQFPRQPTRGPVIHLASKRKPHFEARKRKTKRRLGDIKEGFIVSGSGTVLNEIDEGDSDDHVENNSLAQDHSNRPRAHSTLRNATSRDYLASDEVKLEDLKLREIDSTTMIEVFKEVADSQKMDSETYLKKVAEALGFDEDQYNDFARVNVFKTVNKNTENGESICDDTTIEMEITTTTDLNGKASENGECNCNDTKIEIEVTETTDMNGKASVRSILNSSILQSMTVKDLPERIREKLMSLLRLQRKRRQKQALSNKRRASDIGQTDPENSANYRNAVSKELRGEDIGNERRGDSVGKTNRNKRDLRAKKERLQGHSVDGIDNAEETSETMINFRKGRSRVTSSSGRRYSMISSLDSDEEGFSASRSPSDVLAYKDIQNQHRSMKKNPSVKNRSGQPDTPHQRLGSYFIGAPGNSSSFYSYDNGDSDEENWGRGRAPRVGSSRAHMSDSRTSYMSEMARVPHVTDSQTSMLQKYSRTMGSARARKDVSFSNLDDQMSYGSLGNDDSIYDSNDDATGTRANPARRATIKKEKGDRVKRPRIYHSKVIQDMALGQGSPSVSHVTPFFVDANATYDSHARLSQARISLTEANSALSCDSTVINKRPVRPASSVTVKERVLRREETPEPEPVKQHRYVTTPVQAENCTESIYQLPPLEAAIPEDSTTTPPVQAQEKQGDEKDKPKKLFKRVEKSKPLFSIEDLNVIHRLPVSSAFTYSFCELPSQHRRHNESIKKAAARIGRRKKKASGHFRSKSAP